MTTDDKSDWDRWLAEHIKVCETCRASFEEMAGAMCEEAFAKLQAELKKHKEPRP